MIDPSEWEVTPYVGVGPIKFGMPPRDVIRALGRPERPLFENVGRFFGKIGKAFGILRPPHSHLHINSYEHALVLDYQGGGLSICFDKFTNRVDCLSFSAFALSGPLLHGKQLLGAQWQDVITWMNEWNYEYQSVDDGDAGLDCVDIGMSLFPGEGDDGREIVSAQMFWTEEHIGGDLPLGGPAG
jgi:hypothetical protein